MSLGINTTTPEGIVLAADSRQSYMNHKGIGRIGSDSATKVFDLNERIGLIIAGIAFLPDNGTLKNISGFIEDFKASNDLKKLSVAEVSNKLHEYFSSKYDYKARLEELKKNIEVNLKQQGATIEKISTKDDHIEFSFKDGLGNIKNGVAGVDRLQFIVAGYNIDDSHQVGMVNVPGKVEIKRDSNKKGGEYGASWIGQTDVVSRIVLGFDNRIRNLPFAQKAFSEEGGKIDQQLVGLEYAIQWGTMTLQDGIDFSKLIINTTSAIQRFSDGVIGDPGDVPGVGGPVDIAIITKDAGFKWIRRKELSA